MKTTFKDCTHNDCRVIKFSFDIYEWCRNCGVLIHNGNEERPELLNVLIWLSPVLKTASDHYYKLAEKSLEPPLPGQCGNMDKPYFQAIAEALEKPTK